MRRMFSKKQILDMGPESIKGKDINVGDLSASGDVKVFENIVDQYGHKRFVEGEVTLHANIPQGITLKYGKWSLSGTHLQIAGVLDMDADVVIPNGTGLLTCILPEWVHDKLVPIQGSILDYESFEAVDDSYAYQNVFTLAVKSTDNKVNVSKLNALTITAAKSVRIQYDFIIDNEDQE